MVLVDVVVLVVVGWGPRGRRGPGSFGHRDRDGRGMLHCCGGYAVRAYQDMHACLCCLCIHTYICR